MRNWVRLGLHEDSYWTKTPRLTAVIVAGANERLTREHNELAWLAWHIISLDRSKRMPKLDRLLMRNAPRTRQTWQEQMAIMGALAEATKPRKVK